MSVEVIVHKPENQKPLDKIYAILSRDNQGREGIVGATLDEQYLPLISGSKHIIEEMAERFCKMGGHKYKQDLKVFLVEFTGKIDIRELT